MASPDVVMFIRHGEKPGDDGPPHGIDHNGVHDPHALSVRGWTRAGALAGMFATAPDRTHPRLVVPERVYATKSTHSYKSKREVDTATPLAQRLALDIDASFDHSEAPALSDAILGDQRPALVVWHHGSMPTVLERFPISNRGEVPAAWPDDRFDLVWVLTRDSESGDYAFAVVPQNLLDGDGPV